MTWKGSGDGEVRDVISDNMATIQGPDNLREVFEETLTAFYGHGKAAYAKLENRVRNEVRQDARNYGIWTTILLRAHAKGSPYLFPMIAEDSPPNAEKIREELECSRTARVDTILIDDDYLVCKAISESGQSVKGQIKCNSMTIPIRIQLRPAKRYFNQLQSLHSLFQYNAVPWATINAPYLKKMFDVVITYIDESDIGNLCDPIQYGVEYGELLSRVRGGMVPVWNIHTTSELYAENLLPVLYKTNFEYTIDLEQNTQQCGFLICPGSCNLSTVRRQKTMLTSIAHEHSESIMNLALIYPRRRSETEVFEYPLMSNLRKPGVPVLKSGASIRTKEDLVEYLEGFECFSGYILESIKILPRLIEGETYDCNEFMVNEICDGLANQTLALYFRPKHGENHMHRDVISFFTTQIQWLFPEFICKGFLL